MVIKKGKALTVLAEADIDWKKLLTYFVRSLTPDSEFRHSEPGLLWQNTGY